LKLLERTCPTNTNSRPQRDCFIDLNKHVSISEASAYFNLSVNTTGNYASATVYLFPMLVFNYGYCWNHPQMFNVDELSNFWI
jgi:hypothetical protein